MDGQSARKASKQLHLLAKQPLAYGGELLKTRRGRARGRTLSAKDSMHLVLRSSKAVKHWSFARPQNRRKVETLFTKFAQRYGVKIFSVAYAGNHIHAQIRLASRHTYRPFIRGLTGAIAMAITGVSRWNKNAINASGLGKNRLSETLRSRESAGQSLKARFWDYRPFTRVIRGFRAFLNLRDYIEVNRLEGFGYTRDQARFLIAQDKEVRAGPFAFLV